MTADDILRDLISNCYVDPEMGDCSICGGTGFSKPSGKLHTVLGRKVHDLVAGNRHDRGCVWVAAHNYLGVELPFPHEVEPIDVTSTIIEGISP